MKTATPPVESPPPSAGKMKARAVRAPEFHAIGTEKLRVDPQTLHEAAALSAPLVSITVEQYHRMLAAGLIHEGAPIELIKGMLVRKNRAARGADSMTIGESHATVIGKLLELHALLKTHQVHIRIQQPVTLPSDGEPEPDAAIVPGTLANYADHHPGPGEILCVIEAADSSLENDRTVKQSVYASAGIPQYLIINIPDKQIEVHEQPLPSQGRYGQVAIVKPGQNVALLAGPDKRLEVPVAELLP